MLIQKLKKNWLAIVSAAYSLLVALFWLALRVNWAGISKALGGDKSDAFFVMHTPLLICVFLWLAFIYSVVAAFVWGGKRKAPFIVSLAISGVFTIICIVVIALGAIDYMQFILPLFGESLLICLCLAAFGLLLFFPATDKGKLCTTLKCVTLGIAIFGTVLIAFDVKANYFTYDPVVYAVEDDYQIVFSTNDESIVWVEIDGQKYYDLYAGSMKSKDLVHKVTVPQKDLDEAKHYTVCAQTMIYRGPFGGYKGSKVMTKEYNFRPVNVDDGLDYYSMTDVHGARKGALKAYQAFENDVKQKGREVDFLVILGDSYSMIDSEFDAQFTNLLANDATKGEIPVIYARGNHEIKGRYAEDLYKYVGSLNQKYYYEFELAGGRVYGITLDLGEDHTAGANDDDGWWEYYGTDVFSQYRNEQTEFLKNIADNKQDKYLNSDYNLVCCHIPVQFVNARNNNIQVKADWTALLNKIKPDLVVSGHQHDLYPFLQDELDNHKTVNNDKNKLNYNSQFTSKKTYGGHVTDYEFNSFICGRRGKTQTDDIGSLNMREHIGLGTSADITAGTQTHVYWNSHGQQVEVFNPFVEGTAQTVFTTLLK